jgi:hypothetical protein
MLAFMVHAQANADVLLCELLSHSVCLGPPILGGTSRAPWRGHELADTHPAC